MGRLRPPGNPATLRVLVRAANVRRVQSRLTRAAVAVGLGAISPGRNIQFIPFSTMRFSSVADHPDQASLGDTEANIVGFGHLRPTRPSDPIRTPGIPN